MFGYRVATQLFISLLLVISLLGLPALGMAQDGSTISMSGEVRLDVGVAEKDYSIDVTVYNHSIVILAFPVFTILRPVLSSVTQQLVIPSGSDSAVFSLDGISTDAVDYRIEFECVDCGAVFPTQYFTLDGNVFRNTNEVFIDPDDFPNQLDFVLQSGTSITGRLVSDDGRTAFQDFLYLLRVVRVMEPKLTQASTVITIPKGTSEAPFEFSGLLRTADQSDFVLTLDCLNCRAQDSVPEEFSPVIPSNIDALNIDFRFDFERPIVLPFLNYLISN